jgi:pimeloyl-ACP methyl ester carboxylesterase
MQTNKFLINGLTAFALLALYSCGSGTSSDVNESFVTDSSTTRGTLTRNPPERVASWGNTSIIDRLLEAVNGSSIRKAAGDAICGVDFHQLEYWTVDALNKAVAVSGVLMVPTGSSAKCTGARPTVLYGHGTSFEKGYNLASITNTNNAAFLESLEIAAIFAAQGYIVIAPNYVGYHSSRTSAHPYLVAEQSANDMTDAYTAARKALGKIAASGVSENGKLFITGYSQGGHVAMATHRSMQARGQTVTASAPMSGPYAMGAFVDAVIFGKVGFSSTQFIPLLTSSYQATYGNLYSTTSDVYESKYATGIDKLFPSDETVEDLIKAEKIPEKALFSDSTPRTGESALDAQLAKSTDVVYSQGFGTPNLVLNSFRVAVARDANLNPDGAVSTPKHPFRTAAKTNDMRNWEPNKPMLLCGGGADPTVFFDTNTKTMQSYWSKLPSGRLKVLDIDRNTSPNETEYANEREGFEDLKEVYRKSGGEDSVRRNYHVSAAIFCTAAARRFFDTF